MNSITHDKQQSLWEEEHKAPYVLKQMDSDAPSSGVTKFWEWFDKSDSNLKGIEMGCGKGRNVIWLAKQNVNMSGFDFSTFAIEEGKKRAKEFGVGNKTTFFVQDATKTWKSESNSFDFAIDCFASTDIESFEGRTFARDEFIRTLKHGGHLLVYTLSIDDEFHKEMIKISPTSEKNSFLHPTTGKFEKTFDRDELLEFYKDLKLVKEERVSKTTNFFGKDYKCKHFWMVFQKN